MQQQATRPTFNEPDADVKIEQQLKVRIHPQTHAQLNIFMTI